MRVDFPCGPERIALELPERARVLEPRPVPALARPREAVRQALARPLGAPALLELARGRSSACLVVSDYTRPVPHHILLPPILETLHAAGLAPEQITILVATGMHEPCTGPQLQEILGPEICAHYPVLNHDCRSRAGLRQVAEIEGWPIEINSLFLAAELKILTGLIEPHTFAGYSGGAKSMLPGLASFATMEFMHSYALVADPRVRACALEDNPFQEHVRRVAQTMGPMFMVNALLNRERALSGVFAGDCLAAHRQGAAASARQSVLTLEQPADLVVTSGGGHPLDQTFFQANKGLLTARDLARPGAEVLLLAGCGQGLGGAEFCGLLQGQDAPARFHAAFAQGQCFVIDQWAAQRFFQAREHFRRVHLHAPGLGPDEAASLGLRPAPDPQATVNSLCARAERIVAIPAGPYVVAQVQFCK